MREATQPDLCVYCHELITHEQLPCKVMPDGRKAHLRCYVDHMDQDEAEIGR